MPSPPSLPRPKSMSPPQSLPPEVMTQQDWEEVWEIEYQFAQEECEKFQKKLNDLMGDRKTWELTQEEHKKLEEIIDYDITNYNIYTNHNHNYTNIYSLIN